MKSVGCATPRMLGYGVQRTQEEPFWSFGEYGSGKTIVFYSLTRMSSYLIVMITSGIANA